MQKKHIYLLFILVLFAHCKRESDNTPSDTDGKDTVLTGVYEGYKVFSKSAKDSSAVSLLLEKVSDTEMILTETSPFAHITHIKLDGLNFAYDRGTGESQCGAIRISGAGHFKGRQLYFLETIKCVTVSAPEQSIVYRVTKKQ